MAVTAEVEIPGQPNAVTHGADRVSDRPQPLVAQLAPEAPWPCEGDGQSGRRVQLLYVSTGPTDATSLRPTFESIIRRVEGTFLTSARKTGGERLVRFVTSPDCVLNIANATVSQNAIASFDQMITELSAQGYNRSDRIYHSWVEGSAFCGIGTVYNDDRPTGNFNERYAQYSRTDRNCFGYAEAHELMHNLGGVQNSAPNATDGLHCRDESDQMCYADGAPKGQMVQVCPLSHEDLLDCRNDDYFAVVPAGSYLSTHWNTANASALSRGAVSTTSTTTPPQPTTTTSTTLPPTTSTSVGKGKTATKLVLPRTIRSGEKFTAVATVTGDCKPSGTVGFYVSGRLMSSQVLVNGVATAVLTVTADVARPTFRADFSGSETCDKSRATVRKTVTQ